MSAQGAQGLDGAIIEVCLHLEALLSAELGQLALTFDGVGAGAPEDLGQALAAEVERAAIGLGAATLNATELLRKHGATE